MGFAFGLLRETMWDGWTLQGPGAWNRAWHTLGLSHPQPRTAGSSLTSHFLPSLSLSENGDCHLLL